MKYFTAIFILLVYWLVAAFIYEARAQFLTLGVSGATDNGTPATPCSDGQLDFSDACNTTLYMVVLSR